SAVLDGDEDVGVAVDDERRHADRAKSLQPAPCHENRSELAPEPGRVICAVHCTRYARALIRIIERISRTEQLVLRPQAERDALFPRWGRRRHEDRTPPRPRLDLGAA